MFSYHWALPTGKQTWILWQTPASGSQQLGYLGEGVSWRALVCLKLTTLIYPHFHREQQAVFRDFSNSCAFQTKTLFRKMIQMWYVCFSMIQWDFPTQMALCVLLEDRVLTSRMAKAWWMTSSSWFTFGWWSELNRQNAWVSAGQCPACSDLFLLDWVDPGAFVPSRFDKLNKAGLLQSLTPEFLSRQQNSASWISRFYCHLCLHSASLPTSRSTMTSAHLLQEVIPPKIGASGTQGLCSTHFLQVLKVIWLACCFLSKIPWTCKVPLSSSVLWAAFSGNRSWQLTCYILPVTGTHHYMTELNASRLEVWWGLPLHSPSNQSR